MDPESQHADLVIDGAKEKKACPCGKSGALLTAEPLTGGASILKPVCHNR